MAHHGALEDTIPDILLVLELRICCPADSDVPTELTNNYGADTPTTLVGASSAVETIPKMGNPLTR